eukprot:CAMPEP_0170550406 /NCGR_PEP_ID=MMETSP0211-20121228/8474_1 /TAXON_ID=311385 /ORGANISM="Pseudokeronopsis sp., Strain OXSARD2" /LENGTH=96 /DNA_ID=CAMNT_0010856945 /DNA_START=740 /DNA_END=1027 /DNA_ORIENTATION=-
MTCSRCGKYFCWSCVKVIEGYEHFRDSPSCGDILLAALPTEISPNIGEIDSQEEEDEIIKGAMVDSASCPKCLQIISRRNKINYLICYKCKTEFCF